jgi:hypothetical protein
MHIHNIMTHSQSTYIPDAQKTHSMCLPYPKKLAQKLPCG